MGTMRIDGHEIPFQENDNILKAALAANIEIPYFCYHAALGSLGACRLCAVEVASVDPAQKPRVVMSCLEFARDGLSVSVSAAAARQVRQRVIEFLMINHPHDCPVCDEGGECHLQDMTVACGPPYRRYRGRKRTFTNQYLGPLVHHEMNRCITCYRCTRFYQDYALGDDLGSMRLRNEVYFGRFQDGPLTSPFAGNLVEICPTGVFTDAVFRQHFARVWDLQTAPSICPHCSVGCNTLPGARDGTLRRVRNRFHPELNRWFICDRGRYGHQYSEHPDRPLTAQVAGVKMSYREALAAAAEQIKAAGDKTGGLGSTREDLESNAMLQTLLNKLSGRFATFSDPQLETATAAAVAALQSSGGAPSLAEIEQADAALVVGDLTAHAPMMDLALRQAYRNGAKLAILHSGPCLLTRFAATTLTVAPHEIGAQLLHLNEQAATASNASNQHKKELADIATCLTTAQRPILIGVSETMSAPEIAALVQLATALGSHARLAYALPGANAYGTTLLTPTNSTNAVLEAIELGQIQTLIVMGNDPLGDARLGARWRAARQRLSTLIVLDCVATTTAEAADILLPVAAWAERGGTFVNYEGRAQGFAPVFQRAEPLPNTVEVLADLAHCLELTLPDVPAVLNNLFPGYQTPFPGTMGPSLPAPSLTMQTDTTIGTASITHPGHWQVALTSWYGDDALASYAAALVELAPAAAVLIHPTAAFKEGIEDKEQVRLRGPAGTVVLPVQLNNDVAADTIALARVTLAQLGVGHGDLLELERIL
ncbi:MULTISPECIES: NADH-quinone oxidoreductase subunit NuoG [Nitrosomonas]|uniref:NADH-quinone oxidoreductase n=1 Tax=Nitrosomonas communis TaxID=44574 RepID=A0A5D3YF06_9PROT|nr:MULTISPECIES: NADH-quinone oxidoreductase subunit NuoG [Nitrosomonas]TYP91269.1 NADH-quinone oxidoreductase subunit G [Nitrosomonas communis]UVS61303.1 NADH-quinone oxidoreductase subunit NuoG [Nitrosomonas sp. PLL12]